MNIGALQTPWSLRARSTFYAELAQMSKAGFTTGASFERLNREGSSKDLRHIAGQISTYLKLGKSLEEILNRLGPQIPILESSMLLAGNQSGRLEQTYKALATYYEQSAAFREKLMQAVGYPFFLVHMAIFVFPSSHFKVLVNSGLGPFLLLKSIPIVILWGLVLIPAMAVNDDSPLKVKLENFVAGIPLLGTAIMYSNLARFCLFLEGLVAAGFRPDESWPLAARASGSAKMSAEVSSLVSGIRGGKSPSQLLKSQGVFPTEFLEQIKTGELSGTMEETLKRLGKYYEERAAARFQTVLDWTSRGFKLLVLIVIGYQIISSFSSVEVPQFE